jgi:NAD dependent epimerase/dehydratase
MAPRPRCRRLVSVSVRAASIFSGGTAELSNGTSAAGAASAHPLAGASVVVTGAAGFIGAHLCGRLVEHGARVRGFTRYNSRTDRGALDWLEPAVAAEIDVVGGDIRDVESIAGALAGREVVFHLAAQIAIPYSYVNPRDFFETNVLGTFNVAESARSSGVRRVIHASTSEVYGSARVVPIDELHPLEPQSPYAASKLAADKLMDSYHRSYEVPITVVRPFNTFGPFQSARAIVPTILTQAIAGDRLRLGSLDPRRDLTYVSDTVDGFIAAAASDAAIGCTLQLGTGVAVSIRELVELVAEIVGRELEVEHDPARVRPRNSEVMHLISNPERALGLTGWSPQVSLREGLERTLAWIAANTGRYRADQYVI